MKPNPAGDVPTNKTRTRHAVTFVTGLGILSGAMKTLTVREFRTHPQQVRKTIASAPESLLTASGKPFALVIPVNSETLDETVDALRIGRAQTALRALREESKRKELDRLTPDEIDAIIISARRQRRARRAPAARR